MTHKRMPFITIDLDLNNTPETGNVALQGESLETGRAIHTIRDVARLAGVSTATVSRVLNESARVSPQAQVRVQKAVGLLGYELDQAARQLSMRKGSARGHGAERAS